MFSERKCLCLPTFSLRQTDNRHTKTLIHNAFYVSNQRKKAEGSCLWHLSGGKRPHTSISYTHHTHRKAEGAPPTPRKGEKGRECRSIMWVCRTLSQVGTCLRHVSNGGRLHPGFIIHEYAESNHIYTVY